MKNLLIEWKHLNVKGKTCRRCADTGKNITHVLEDLRNDPRFKEITLNFNEIELPAGRIGESNQILLNGRPFEKFIDGAEAGANECGSCAGLVGKPVKCRTVCCGDETMETITGEVIREAVLNWLGREGSINKK